MNDHPPVFHLTNNGRHNLRNLIKLEALVWQQLEVTSCTVSRQAYRESVIQFYCSHCRLLYPNQFHLLG